jgi:hypothetical protein
MEAALYDKNRRPIEVGDVLKVFHYIAARNRKRCYMYKQVLSYWLSKSGEPYFRIGHLDMSGDDYLEARDGRVLAGYEIVQSVDAKFEDRPRLLT